MLIPRLGKRNSEVKANYAWRIDTNSWEYAFKTVSLEVVVGFFSV